MLDGQIQIGFGAPEGNTTAIARRAHSALFPNLRRPASGHGLTVFSGHFVIERNRTQKTASPSPSAGCASRRRVLPPRSSAAFTGPVEPSGLWP